MPTISIAGVSRKCIRGENMVLDETQELLFFLILPNY
jgi:hypothetical protein